MGRLTWAIMIMAITMFGWLSIALAEIDDPPMFYMAMICCQVWAMGLVLRASMMNGRHDR